MMKLIGRSNKVGHLSSPDRQTDHQVVHLSVGQCFSDCFEALIQHPILFVCTSVVTVLLGAASGLLLMGSLYAGFMMLFLKAMDDKDPSLRDLFGHLRQFPRFFAMMVFCIGVSAIGLVIAFLPLVVVGVWQGEWTGEVWTQVLALIGKVAETSWGYRLALFSFVIGAVSFAMPRILLGVRCIHVLQLAADQKLPADEAYMESKKAVYKYGFKQHVFLMVIVLWLVAICGEVFVGLLPSMGWWALGVVLIVVQPLFLGVFASAYRQTLQVVAHQHLLDEEKVTEMRDELQMARDMQMGLLPVTDPDIDGYDVGDICIPANAVCGDYYTYRWLNDRYFAIVAADVSGKAMKAAVTALRFNEMLRYECKGRTDAAEILGGLDDSLEGQLDDYTFITCCIAVLDTHTHTVEIANAGHSEPYLFLRKKKKADAIVLAGYPLGLPKALRQESGYKKVQITLEPGDFLTLYSDGVVDAYNANGEQYEEQRFMKLLDRSGLRLEPNEMMDHVVQDIERHIGNAPQTDDISLVMLKRRVYAQSGHTPAVNNQQTVKA